MTFYENDTGLMDGPSDGQTDMTSHNDACKKIEKNDTREKICQLDKPASISDDIVVHFPRARTEAGYIRVREDVMI